MTTPPHSLEATPADTAADTPVIEAAVAKNAGDEQNKQPTKPPNWFQRQWRRVTDKINDYRQATITALPNNIVNNNSNVIGSLQVLADISMLKSSGMNMLERQKAIGADRIAIIDKAGWNPLKIVGYPIINVFDSIFSKVRSNGKLSDIVKPEFYKKTYRDFVDLKGAALRDSAGGTKKLINTWSARSSVCGITSMAIGAMLLESKQTPEETEHEVIQKKTKPLTYTLIQIGRAIWFLPQTAIQLVKKTLHPDNDQRIGLHKHQFIGLSFMFVGLFSMLSGFRQVTGKEIGKQNYMRNGGQIAGGALTLLAGTQLLTGADSEQGWEGFGTSMILRNIPLLPSIKKRFVENEQGRWHYFIAQCIFQVKNFFCVLVGGAEKLPDGTIVDHQKIREEGREKAKTINTEKRISRFTAGSYGESQDKDSTPLTPASTIAAVTASEPTKAMPERGAEKRESELRATVGT